MTQRDHRPRRAWAYRLSEDGTPVAITQQELIDILNTGEPLYRQIRCDKLPDRLVSTVFLRIDHGIGLQKAPVLWETMVFDDDGEVSECRRYTSQADAIRGHDEIVTAWMGQKR